LDTVQPNASGIGVIMQRMDKPNFWILSGSFFGESTAKTGEGLIYKVG